MVRDLNRIGDRVSASITSAFEVPGENDMEEEWRSSVLKKDCAWVIHTLSTGVCISTQGGQDGVELRSMIDLVQVKKDMLQYV